MLLSNHESSDICNCKRHMHVILKKTFFSPKVGQIKHLGNPRITAESNIEHSFGNNKAHPMFNHRERTSN